MGGRKREHVRDERGTSLCVKRERLECHVLVTCNSGYREKNRVAWTRRWAKRVKQFDVLDRGGFTRSVRGDEMRSMRICAGNARVQKKKERPRSRSDSAKQHKISSLRCFPVQVRHFHTGGLLNESAVGFGFDGPAQRLSRDLTFVRWVGSLGRRIYRREAPRRRSNSTITSGRRDGGYR